MRNILKSKKCLLSNMKKIIKHYPMTDRLIVRRGYKIADSLRKIHISENREKITVQKLIYQEVN
jgi:hypothetical protein